MYNVKSVQNKIKCYVKLTGLVAYSRPV